MIPPFPATPSAGRRPSGGWPAVRWLRAAEAALFLALLGLAEVRAIVGQAPWSVHVLVVVVAGAFAAGLARVERWPGAGRAAWLMAVSAGTLALVALSRDFVWTLFPLWMLTAHLLALPVALVLTAVSLAVVITCSAIGGDESAAAVLGPIVGALVAVGVARGVLRFQHEASEHQRLLGEVLAAQDEAAALADQLAASQREAGALAERARLARDIHDTLAQGFSSIVLLARAAGRERDAEAVRRLVREIESTASAELAESRRVVYALAPAPGGELAASIGRLASEAAQAMGAELTLDLQDVPRLSTAAEVALLRAAQSALANVRRHAGASSLAVTLGCTDRAVRLDVVDDGRGFDPASVPATPTLAGGYGLRAMRERLTALGGALAVESEPGGGTALTASVPLVTREEES